MHFAETHYIKSYILVYCGILWYNVVGAFADTGHHSTHPVFAFFSSARARADTVVGFRHLCDVVYHGTLWYIVIYCGTLWHNVVGAFADTGHHSSPAAPQHLLIASLTTTTPTMFQRHLVFGILPSYSYCFTYHHHSHYVSETSGFLSSYHHILMASLTCHHAYYVSEAFKLCHLGHSTNNIDFVKNISRTMKYLEILYFIDCYLRNIKSHIFSFLYFFFNIDISKAVLMLSAAVTNIHEQLRAWWGS